MKSRRFLLAAVGAVLSAPAYASPNDIVVLDEEVDVVAVVEAAVGADPEARPAKRDEKQGRGPRDLSVCEVTTANTKGPSYDADCLARINQ